MKIDYRDSFFLRLVDCVECPALSAAVIPGDKKVGASNDFAVANQGGGVSQTVIWPDNDGDDSHFAGDEIDGCVKPFRPAVNHGRARVFFQYLGDGFGFDPCVPVTCKSYNHIDIIIPCKARVKVGENADD